MGHLPADAAYQWAGLVVAAGLNRFIAAHSLYLAMAVLSATWLLYVGLFQRRVGAFVTHMIATLVLLIGFGTGPTASIPLPVSRAEQLAPDRVYASSRQFADGFGLSNAERLPLGMLLVSQAIDGFVIGAASLVDPLTKVGGTTHMSAPLALHAALTAVVAADLRYDPPLSRDFETFRAVCQREAIRRFLPTAPPPSSGFFSSSPTLWDPSTAALVSLYPTITAAGTPLTQPELFPTADTCHDVWKALTPRLGAYAKTHYGPPSSTLCVAGWGWCDSPLKQIFKNTASVPSGLSLTEESGRTIGIGGGVGWAIRNLGSIMSGFKLAPIFEQVIQASPYIQGTVLAFAYGLVPMTLMLSLFPKQYMLLLTHFSFILSVKMWTWGWLLVGLLYKVMLPIVSGNAQTGEGILHGSVVSVVSLVNMMAYIGSPLLITAVLTRQGQRLGGLLTQFSGLSSPGIPKPSGP